MNALIGVSAWELLGAASAAGLLFLGAIWAIATFLLRRYDASLAARFRSHEASEGAKYETLSHSMDARFEAIERARMEGQARWQAIFDEHIAQTRKREEAIGKLERDFLNFLARLPLDYVRKEDDVRNQSITSAKLDALAAKIDSYLHGYGAQR